MLSSVALKDGLTAELRWSEVPQKKWDSNKGFRVFRVSARVGDEEAGYLRVAYICSSLHAERNPTVWHHIPRFSGWCYYPGDLYETWRAYKKYQLNVLSIDGLARRSDEEMQADLDRWAQMPFKGFRTIQDWIDKCSLIGHLDFPYVDYAKVRDKYLRKGIATAMYIFAAKLLAEQGMLFRSSGIQSPRAKALWSYLRWRKDIPTRQHVIPWHNAVEVTIIDYSGDTNG